MLDLTVSKLLEEFQIARAESDRLFAILKPQYLYHRPIAERHRVIFYLGHLDGFDSIQICREGLGIKSNDVQLDALFQAGIDPDSTNLPADTEADWPSLEQIQAYANRCRARVDAELERAPESVVYMALEHRLMHMETLAYMFHNFDYEMKIRALRPTYCSRPNRPASSGATFRRGRLPSVNLTTRRLAGTTSTAKR